MKAALRLSLTSLALTASSLFVLPSCARRPPTTSTTTLTASAAATVQKIYLGGKIVTMDPATPRVEAVAVRDGVIIRVGTRDEILALRSPITEVVDLGGKTLLPGFVDADGHLAFAAATNGFVNLSPPPRGKVSSLGEAGAALKHALGLEGLTPASWIVGWGYDETMTPERREPTRADLDTLSKDTPIVIFHASLRHAVANSAAIRAAKLPPETVREPAGTVNERGMAMLMAARPQPPMDEKLRQLDAAQALYASHGITTAQDTGTLGPDLDMFDEAAKAHRLKVDVVSYPHWTGADQAMAARTVGSYRDHFKVGGVAMLLDGTDDERVKLFTLRMLTRRAQLMVQCDTPAAIDQFVDVVAAALPKVRPYDHRATLLFDIAVRDDQLDRMKELGIAPSFFASYIYYWGDVDRAATPDAARTIPTGSAARRGMPLSLHADAPVSPPDPLFLVWSAVTRTTRSGAVLGPDQRIDAPTALRGVTAAAAWQHFEDDRKGSITAGKLADLVVLSDNPLEVSPESIKDIRVVETIKGGVTIHRASAR